ncbi:MAG: acetylglutamate kinase [bacterium]
MHKYIEKAKILIESLPYIKKFNGKTVVIKYGGSAMLNENLKKAVMQDIALMKLVGIRPVIVHGGGPEINSLLEKIGKKAEFIDGLRVTDDETMECVEMVLAGKVNKSIVNHLLNIGGNAVGISGKDANIIEAEKKLVNGKDVGLVGEVKNVNPQLINTLIESDFVPVIAPVGRDKIGLTYNINADYAAEAIAVALNAEKLVFLTDVEGVLMNKNDSSSLISSLKVNTSEKLIEAKIIQGGMIPKIECCNRAVKNGVKTVHILDGRVEHSLLLEIFTEAGIGTMIEE